MIIDCIGCLHGARPKLEGGDLLIVTGDLTASDTHLEYQKFFEWLRNQKYKKKIFIGGNHDNKLIDFYCTAEELTHFEYLCDSGTEFERLKIWGTPWTSTFPDINPKCCAFTVDEDDKLAEKWAMIPGDTDILISHGPPYGILDKTDRGECVGSKSLQMELYGRLNPKLFVCSHIHEAYGSEPPGGIVQKAVNCSIMNERYQPVNAPIRIILNDTDFPKCG